MNDIIKAAKTFAVVVPKIKGACPKKYNKSMKQQYVIKKYSPKMRQQVIDFLKSVAIDEFGFSEWKQYLENKDFSSYEKGESIFYVAYLGNQIIATCGGLKKDDTTIKLNSFYIHSVFVTYFEIAIVQHFFCYLFKFCFNVCCGRQGDVF